MVVTAGFIKTASLRLPIGGEQVTITTHGYQQQQVDIIPDTTPPSPSHGTDVQANSRSMRAVDRKVLRELGSR